MTTDNEITPEKVRELLAEMEKIPYLDEFDRLSLDIAHAYLIEHEKNERLHTMITAYQDVIDVQREALEFYEYLHDDGFKARQALGKTS